MGIQELTLANNPFQCDCFDMFQTWMQQLQHYQALRHQVFANSKMIGCMDSTMRCHTYFTQHLWSLNAPPFIKAKKAQDMFKQCDIYTMVEPSEPRRFRISPPVPLDTNALEED